MFTIFTQAIKEKSNCIPLKLSPKKRNKLKILRKSKTFNMTHLQTQVFKWKEYQEINDPQAVGSTKHQIKDILKHPYQNKKQPFSPQINHLLRIRQDCIRTKKF